MFIPRYCLLCILVVQCSTKKIPLRIYGGSSASEGEYPFVVRMEARIVGNTTDDILHKHFCSASALTSTWALTAGHCVDYSIKLSVKTVVRYGPVENSPHQENTFSDVLLKIVHPIYTYNYQIIRRSTMKNDIGLLKTTPMKVKSFGKLSAVDFFSLYGYEAVQAGFGITTTELPDGKILTNSTLNLLKPLQVMKVLMYRCKANNLQPRLCLAPKCGRRISACPGDSGGPLIHPSGVVGVASLADGIADCLIMTTNRRPLVAGHILPISPYMEWIQSYVTA